jgi:phosphoglycerol transferase MdoB-like AlkP superfamily enzyme
MDRARITVFRLIAQMAILIAAYFLCRLVFVWANKAGFNFATSLSAVKLFFYGLRFDLSAIFITNSLFLLLSLLPLPFTFHHYYQAFLKWLFIITNSFFLLLNIIDVAYFPFIHKRMQFDAFLFLDGTKGNDFYNLLPKFLLQYWYLWLFFFALVFLLHKAYSQTLSLKQKVAPSFKNYLYSLLTFIIVMGLSIVAIRGGLQMKPLGIIHASEMTEVQNIPAILNTPFSIINTFNKKRLAAVTYFDDAQISASNSGIHTPQTTQPFSKQNVFVIIVESLSKKYLSFFNGPAKTPFIDSLFAQSMVFTNAFANAKESIQGIPAILSSIPSWQNEPFIFSPYSANKITSLANILKKEGYSSSFFHGGGNGTMGFDSYCKLAAFDTYYGRNEYNNDKDFDGDWGIWDEPFLQFTADKLSQTKQPFVSAVFTLNTHHPFTVPEKYRERFKQNGHPIISCMQYLNLALAAFFEKAKKTAWFNNTLFIITADHTGPQIEQGVANVLDDYRIPIAFYKPGGLLKGIDSSICNQIDILPSVLHLLNYPQPYFSQGNNLFEQHQQNFSINFNAGIYQCIDSAYCYQFNGQNAIGFYNWHTDSLFANNLYSDKLPGGSYKKNEAYLKQKIQIFNNTMINNTMQTGQQKK